MDSKGLAAAAVVVGVLSVSGTFGDRSATMPMTRLQVSGIERADSRTSDSFSTPLATTLFLATGDVTIVTAGVAATAAATNILARAGVPLY